MGRVKKTLAWLADKKRIKRIVRVVIPFLFIALLGYFLLSHYAALRNGEYNSLIRAFAVKKANERLTGRFEIASLDGDPLSRLIVTGVLLSEAGGRTALSIDKAEIKFSLFKDSRFKPGIAIDLDTAYLRAAKTEAGWNLKTIRKPRPPSGKKRNFPPLQGTLHLKEFAFDLEMGPERKYAIRVPRGLADLELEKSAVKFSVTDLMGSIEPPKLGLNQIDLSGRAESTGEGWAVLIDKGRAVTYDSILELTDGMYHTGTRDLAGTLPEVELGEDTLRLFWAKHPVKVMVRGGLQVKGNMEKLDLEAVVRSEAGDLTAAGSYLPPAKILKLAGVMRDFSPADFLTYAFPLSELNGAFNVKYLGTLEKPLPRRRLLNLLLDVRSFHHPSIASSPFETQFELTGDEYAGSLISAAPGRDAKVFITGQVKQPYPLKLQALVREADPSAIKPSLPRGKLTGILKLAGSGKSKESFKATGRLDMNKSFIRDIGLSTVALEFRYGGGRLYASPLDAVIEGVKLHAVGWIDPLKGNLPFSTDVSAEVLDLELIPRYTKGAVNASAARTKTTLSGDKHKWKAAGEVELVKFRANRFSADRAQANLNLQGKGAKEFQGEVALNLSALFIQGASYKGIAIPEMETRVLARFEPRPLKSPTVHLEVVTDSFDPGYNFYGKGTVAVLPDRAVQLDLDRASVTIIGQRWVLSSPAFIGVKQGNLEIKALSLVHGSQSLSAHGKIEAENINLALIMNRFDLAPWAARLFPEAGYEGQISGSIGAFGKSAEPEVLANLAATGLKFGDASLERAEGSVRYLEKKLEISLRGKEALAGEVRAWGVLPARVAVKPAAARVVMDEPMDLFIDAGDVSLELIAQFLPWAQEVKGAISLFAHITGTPKVPIWNGWMKVEDVSLQVRQWGLALSEVNGSAEIAENKMNIPGLTAESGEGTATLQGKLTLEGFSLKKMNLLLTAADFRAMNTPDIKASLNAKLRIQGDLEYPRFGGEVEFTSLKYRPPLILDYQGSAWEKDDDTIAIKGQETEAEESSPLMDRGSLDLKVKIPDTAELRNSELNVRFGGELTVRKPPGGFYLIFGQVKTVEGMLTFQGKPFHIERGVFEFPAIPVIDPDLDILAAYRVPDYITYLKIGGVLSAPTLEIYSDPPLDSADVLSVIIFGRPISSLTEGEKESLAQTGGQLAAGYAAASLATSLGAALNVDTFVIQAGQSTEESGVGVGKYISNKLYVYYYQPFGEEKKEEFKVRYEIIKNFSLEASQDQQGQGGLDVYYTFEY